MKNIISLLLCLFAFTASAQTCSPKVTLNCNSTLTIEQAYDAAVEFYTFYVHASNIDTSFTVAASTSGPTVITTGFTVDNVNQITVDVTKWTDNMNPMVAFACGYGTTIFCPVFGCTPSGQLGWTYQYGSAPFDAGLNCGTAPSPAPASSGSTGNGKKPKRGQ